MTPNVLPRPAAALNIVATKFENGHTIGRNAKGKIRLLSSKKLAITSNLSAAYEPNARDEWVERARAVKVETVAGRHGLNLNGKGKNREGPCPRCGGTDRFAINLVKNAWHCRGCDKGGRDGISLQQFISGTDFLGAVEYLVGKPPETAPSREVARFDYQNANGQPNRQVRRYEPGRAGKPKDFAQFRPDGSGGWLSGCKGVPHVPYRLPQMLASIEADRTVPILIVEGEKCVEAVAKLGFTATCNDAGTGGGWWPELTQYFRDVHVVLFADNDDKGRRHVAKVAAALKGTAASVRTLNLAEHWPECSESDDIADWIAEGHGADDLDNLIGKARDYMGDAGGRENEPKSAEQTADQIVTVRASLIVPKRVNWIWPNRFARGKMAMLGGHPDLGKSQLLLDVIARITRGAEWPCNEGKAPKGDCLLFTSEDDFADTVVPRLTAAGADLERVHLVKCTGTNEGGERIFSLMTDLPLLQLKIATIPDLVFIGIDPITAHFGVAKADTMRVTDVRGVLAPLKTIAEEWQLLIMAIMHFNKNTNVTNAMMRFSDSAAFVALPRHAYIVTEDPNNEGRFLFLKAKNNIAERQIKGLAYRIEARIGGKDELGDIIAPCVAWETEPVNLTADEALADAADKKKSRGKVDEAAEFLSEALADGPVAVNDLLERGKAQQLSEKTLRRAKDKLKIDPKKNGLDGGWMWTLQERCPQCGQRNPGCSSCTPDSREAARQLRDEG